MTDPKRYFIFSIAQYVHVRREERLNVGVVVFDPETRRLHPGFDAPAAARRISRVYPEVDQRGLQSLFYSLGRGLTADPELRYETDTDSPFALLSAEWQNVLQFTSPRPFPAETAIDAIRRLLHLYVRVKHQRAATGGLTGSTRARLITRQAIQRVLDPVGGILAQEEVEIPRELIGGLNLPIKLPFLLVHRYGIDTLALDNDGPEHLNRETEGFIGKVIALKHLGGEIEPHATVTVNPEHPQRGRALIDYLLFKTRLPEYAIVEAEEGPVQAMISEIKARADAA
jgi:hypothetical protein